MANTGSRLEATLATVYEPSLDAFQACHSPVGWACSG